MTYFPGVILVGEIEKLFTERLPKYGSYIMSLGLDPPFHWIAGISDTKGLCLRVAAGPLIAGPLPSHECLAEHIDAEHIDEEGTYDGKQSPADALVPFFGKIYRKCGTKRS